MSTSQILLTLFKAYNTKLYKRYYIKNDVNCSLFQSLTHVYSNIITYLNKIVEEKYQNDFNGPYYQNFRNSSRLQNISFREEDINNQHIIEALKYANFLSNDLQNFIQKLCKILLDDININQETDLTLIKYYWLNKFVSVYNELMYNQYRVLNNNQRQELINEINIIIPDKFKIFMNGISTYIGLFYYYLNDINDKKQMEQFILFTNKVYNMIKHKINDNGNVQSIPNNNFNNKSFANTYKTINKINNTLLPEVNEGNTKIITNKYNNTTVDSAYIKDDLVKVCNKRNLNISIYQVKSQLETAIFESLKGYNIKQKAEHLGFVINNDVNENGIKVHIIEHLLK